MSKNPLQSLAAKLGRSAANDDAAPNEPEDGKRGQVNLVTAMPPPDAETGENTWTSRLVLFLRVMAVLSMIKGLYHWAQITGFIGGEDNSFEYQTTQWQTATVYFAVIELVAAVGLWLATPWGAVVWLTTIVSTAVIELMFPTIYGGNIFAVLVAAILLVAYLALAWMAARERPP
jgi:Family of unknown function (DUF6163)